MAIVLCREARRCSERARRVAKQASPGARGKASGEGSKEVLSSLCREMADGVVSLSASSRNGSPSDFRAKS
jgi:hypothetical protein